MAVQEKFDLVIRAQDEASATINRVNNEINRLGTSALPGAVANTNKLTDAFTKADLKAAVLGSRIAGVNPLFGQFANVLAFGNPLIGAASVGIGLLAASFFDADEPTKQYLTTLELTNDALGELANLTDQIGGKAKQRKAQRLEELKAEEQSLVQQISAIDVSKTVSAEYDRLGGITQEQTRAWNEQRIAAENLKIRYDDLNARLANNRDEQDKLNAVDEKGLRIKKQAAKDLEMMNKALRERLNLVRSLQQEDFRGIGADASLRGPGYFGVPQDEVDQANKDAKDAMRRLWEIPEEETRMLEEAQAQWMEFSSMVLSSTDQLATGITEMFFGLRDSLSDVFKSMAMNWVKYFISEIIKQTALRLGFQLFNVIFPGSGSALGQAGASDVGVLPFELARRSQSTGIDIAAAGAKRFSGGAQPSSVVIQFNAPIIGDEQFVREKIAPQIERLARFQLTRIQVA